MKLKTLLFIAFVYAIPETFDFQGFLLSCKSSGIKLFAESTADSPHGEAMTHNGELIVTLYDRGVPAVPANLKKKFRGQAGQAVLPSDPKTKGLSVYKKTIDAAVEANRK